MDIQDQLKKLFPDHTPEEQPLSDAKPSSHRIQENPIGCKYEKRKGKPVTLLEGYTGSDSEGKALTRELKTHLGVGGSYKKGSILIQGDYRDAIMDFLKARGFTVKRIGG